MDKWVIHVCLQKSALIHIRSGSLLQLSLPFLTQSNCRWVNIDFISSKVGFSLLRFIASLLCSRHSHSSQTDSTPTLPCQAGHTAKQDLLWLPLNYTPFYSTVYQSKGGTGWGYVEGWGELGWGYGAPNVLSINVGGPHKGPHDRGWVVIMPWPCLPLKVTPFLIALRDGR